DRLHCAHPVKTDIFTYMYTHTHTRVSMHTHKLHWPFHFPHPPSDALSPEGLAAFRTFLKSEFSEENVEFWLACEDFKKTKSSTKIASKAQKIYSDFIQADAPKEVNIDFHTKNDISQNISKPSLSCFDAAQSSVYCLMAKDSFPRFLRSELYKELLRKEQDRNQKRWLPFL
ncbi:RGS21 protein, partial [Poecile atricapillus]|nr:RGS21 protein [Poecile atricapillus]